MRKIIGSILLGGGVVYVVYAAFMKEYIPVAGLVVIMCGIVASVKRTPSSTAPQARTPWEQYRRIAPLAGITALVIALLYTPIAFTGLALAGDLISPAIWCYVVMSAILLLTRTQIGLYAGLPLIIGGAAALLWALVNYFNEWWTLVPDLLRSGGLRLF